MRTYLRSSTLLLALALAACGDAGDPGALDTPRTELPTVLADDWYTGSLSTLQYYDRTTGQWQDPSGEGFYFLFTPDGDYETGAVITSTVAGCTMRLLGTEVGTVVQRGDELTLHRHWIKTLVTSTCGSSGERTQGPSVRTVTWSIDADETGREWLSLVHDDGAVERYRRWE